MAKNQPKESKLLNKKLTVWEQVNDDYMKSCFKFADSYKTFLNKGKTERECIRYFQECAKKYGFKLLKDAKKDDQKLYDVFKNKVMVMIYRGKESVISGTRIVGSHIDSPRLDLKQNPLFEDKKIAFLKTHYYGGIKKYQWLARPLAIHGVIIKEDGTKIDINIGEDDGLCFCITDILPHLDKKQDEKKVSEAFEGEKMNLIVGSIPFKTNDKDEDWVKHNIMAILNKKYGIVEEDFVSSELEVVPAENARDVGLDSSMVGGYGQDDRSCAFTASMALFTIKQPKYTAINILVDKEEIGSEGVTGIQSRYFQSVFEKLIELEGKDSGIGKLSDTLLNSYALSADVTTLLDPNFPDVTEKHNTARMGCGVCLVKYTGARGKYDTNDANAEFVGLLRSLFNSNKIKWQTAELGKIDEGGGGTIAKYMANMGIETIDCGPALLSVHAPFELISKADLYEAFRAYKTFFGKF